MPLVLRISHYAGQRNCRSCGPVHSAGGRHVPAGGKRSRRHQHGVRRGGIRGPRHDRILGPGTQPDAGGHLLHCRRGTAVRDRGCGARGSGPGQHRAGTERLLRMVKGGGHGNYRNLVLAPASVQEMADLTMLAFELADKYRNPAIVLADGFIGQMMEPLDLEYRALQAPEKPWAVKGTAETRKNLVSSIFLEPDDLEEHVRKLEAKYTRAQQQEPRWELYDSDDAEVLLVGYGITSRVLRSAVELARSQGRRVGLFRPITLWPFPAEALAQAAAKARRVLVVELSNGQMLEDVRLSLNGRVPVEFYGRSGGNVPSVEEIHTEVLARMSQASVGELAGRLTHVR